ncbi:MAG: mandelate racemase/muconate lactonizing enzyme family protein [Rhizobiales bacterium]|nr:mandelate racemase/muconate lactonizing enzyme family protein [Hyphomicrobiales bacterium]
MKITRIEATRHVVHNEVPLIERKLTWPSIFVRVETDAGLTGIALTGGGIQPHAAQEIIHREIAPLLIGEDPLAHERLWHRCFYKLNPRYQTGAFSHAISLVDVALWDIKGKHFGEPVWRLIGGSDPTVPAYITFGLHEYDREQLVEAAKLWRDQGHDKLKLVVGADRDAVNVAEDATRVRLVREALGDDAEIMIDANYKLPFHAALELCKRVEPYHLTWFEEPVYGNDPLLLADLRRKTSVPIAAGQNEGSKWRHREFMLNQSVDFVQPNVVYVGGFTEALKVAGMAQAFNLPLANGGGWPHLNGHLMAGMDNGIRVEFHLLMWRASNQLFANAVQPQAGTVTMPDLPGLGLEPNEDALSDSLVD